MLCANRDEATFHVLLLGAQMPCESTGASLDNRGCGVDDHRQLHGAVKLHQPRLQRVQTAQSGDDSVMTMTSHALPARNTGSMPLASLTLTILLAAMWHIVRCGETLRNYHTSLLPLPSKSSALCS